MISKKFSSLILLILSLSLLVTSCVTTTESILQETEVKGAPVRHPIRITENREAGNFIFRGNISFNNKNLLETQSSKTLMVNEQGIFQVDEVPGEQYFLEQENVNIFDFEGNNVKWSIPDLQTRFEIDFAASKSFALTAGVNYSKIQNQAFWGESIGIAFFGEKNNWGYRFDANVSFYEMEVSANYAVIEETDFPRKVIFLSEKRTDSYKDLSFGYTMNSNRRDWLINVFFNYTLGWQTLYNFDSDAVKDIQPTLPFLLPAEIHENFKFFEAYHSFTAGIYKNTFDLGRIVLGARYINYTDSKASLEIPDFFIQYDLIF